MMKRYSGILVRFYCTLFALFVNSVTSRYVANSLKHDETRTHSKIYHSDCSPGYGGYGCELRLSSCDEEPCRNGGSCFDSYDHSEDGKFSCICHKGWMGKYCEQDINECEFPHYCGNDGDCVNILGSFACVCRSGYAGEYCDKVFDSCEMPNFCQNGANCIQGFCICSDGYAGSRCERMVPYMDDFMRYGCKTHAEFCASRFDDGYCDKICNATECLYDGFDCLRMAGSTCRYSVYCAENFENGICDQDCNSVECGFDGGDCENRFTEPEMHNLMLVIPANPSEVLNTSVKLTTDGTGFPKIYGWTPKTATGILLDRYALNNSEIVNKYNAVLASFDVMCSSRTIQMVNASESCILDTTGIATLLAESLRRNDGSLNILDSRAMKLHGESTMSGQNGRYQSLVYVVLGFCSYLIVILGIYGFYGIRRQKHRRTLNAKIWKPAPSGGCLHRFHRGKSFPSKSSLNEPKEKEWELEEGSFPDRILPRIDVPMPIETVLNTGKDLKRELFRAIMTCDHALLAQLLQLSIDLNSTDDDENTALHFAMYSGNEGMIHFLLDTKRCNVYATNCLGQTPLIVAVNSPHACDRCVEILLEAMIEAKAIKTLHCEKPSVDPQNSNLFESRTNENSTFLVSPSINKRQTSYNIPIWDARDVFGRTALHYAARANRAKLIYLLRRRKYFHDVADNQATWLLHHRIVRFSTSAFKGEYAMHIAVREGHLDAVAMLLAQKAEFLVKDQLGRTPLDLAVERNHFEVAQMLRKCFLRINDVNDSFSCEGFSHETKISASVVAYTPNVISRSSLDVQMHGSTLSSNTAQSIMPPLFAPLPVRSISKEFPHETGISLSAVHAQDAILRSRPSIQTLDSALNFSTTESIMSTTVLPRMATFVAVNYSQNAAKVLNERSPNYSMNFNGSMQYQSPYLGEMTFAQPQTCSRMFLSPSMASNEGHHDRPHFITRFFSVDRNSYY